MKQLDNFHFIFILCQSGKSITSNQIEIRLLRYLQYIKLLKWWDKIWLRELYKNYLKISRKTLKKVQLSPLKISLTTSLSLDISRINIVHDLMKHFLWVNNNIIIDIGSWVTGRTTLKLPYLQFTHTYIYYHIIDTKFLSRL